MEYKMEHKIKLTMPDARGRLRPGMQYLWDRKQLKMATGLIYACERLQLLSSDDRIELMKQFNGVRMYKRGVWCMVKRVWNKEREPQ